MLKFLTLVYQVCTWPGRIAAAAYLGISWYRRNKSLVKKGLFEKTTTPPMLANEMNEMRLLVSRSAFPVSLVIYFVVFIIYKIWKYA